MDHSWIGRVVDDRYEIQGVLGRGGMGTVFRARHRLTTMQVALKVMHDVTIDDPVGVQRFIDEARAPSSIGHPAIVEITDANRAPTGELYLAMQLLFGRSLRAALGSLAGEDVRRIGLELLDALAAAHRRGFVHRDLKPENVFLVGGGAVKLLDFGIAKVLGREGRTQKGQMLGTLEYMAPEQLLDASRVDARADLWAVGVILYEAIAGVRPFGGTTFDEKYHALATDLPVPIEHVAQVSPDVAAFFARALARDRERRFASAEEMAAQLRTLALSPSAGASTANAASTGPTLATGDRWDRDPATAPTQLAPPPPEAAPARVTAARRRWPVFAIGGGVLALGILLGVVVVTGFSGSGTPATSDASVKAVDATGSATDGPPAIARAPDHLSEPQRNSPCTTACQALAACKLSHDARSCIARCESGKDTEFNAFHAGCVRANASCDEIAACWWEKDCGGRPRGALGCNSYESKCLEPCFARGGSDRCWCDCVKKLRPTAALHRLRRIRCERELRPAQPAGSGLVDIPDELDAAVTACMKISLACTADE